MSEYQPAFMPGDIITMTVGAVAVVAGNLVKVGAGDMTCIPTTGVTEDTAIGVAAFDAAIGAAVGVYGLGVVHRLVVAGAVTRGDILGPGAVAGTVQKITAVIDADVDGSPSSAHVNLNARAARFIALESIADTAVGRVMAL